MYTLIVTAKMNNVDSQAWLADLLARLAEHPFQRLDELLPRNWKKLRLPTHSPHDARSTASSYLTDLK